MESLNIAEQLILSDLRIMCFILSYYGEYRHWKHMMKRLSAQSFKTWMSNTKVFKHLSKTQIKVYKPHVIQQPSSEVFMSLLNQADLNDYKMTVSINFTK